MEILFQINGVPRSRLYLTSWQLYPIHSLAIIVDDDVGSFLVRFWLPFLKGPLKDQFSFAKDSRFDEFIHLQSGLALVLGHSYGCPLLSLFVLIQRLHELGMVACTKWSKLRLDENLCLYGECKGIRGLPSGLPRSCMVGPKCYWQFIHPFPFRRCQALFSSTRAKFCS